MILTIAVLGWVLFIAVAVLYHVGNKANADESLALAAYSAALLLSDEFRTATRQGIEKSIRENAASSSTPQLVSGTLSAITDLAKDGMQNREATNQLALVVQIVQRVKDTNDTSTQ